MAEKDLIYREAGKLKKGTYIYYDDEIWRVEDIKTSVAGKHGAAKARLKLRSLFGDKSKEIVLSTSDRVSIPNIEKRRGQVIAIIERDGDKAKLVQVMDLETYETFDMEVMDDVANLVEENKEVVYWDVLGRKIIVQVSR